MYLVPTLVFRIRINVNHARTDIYTYGKLDNVKGLGLINVRVKQCRSKVHASESESETKSKSESESETFNGQCGE